MKECFVRPGEDLETMADLPCSWCRAPLPETESSQPNAITPTNRGRAAAAWQRAWIAQIQQPQLAPKGKEEQKIKRGAKEKQKIKRGAKGRAIREIKRRKRKLLLRVKIINQLLLARADGATIRGR